MVRSIYSLFDVDVNPDGKTDEEIADEGLRAMEAWMNEIGLVMNISELGVTEEMLEGISGNLSEGYQRKKKPAEKISSQVCQQYYFLNLD